MSAPEDHRYVCIHGHFYQPPRENPWLESIELQESAYPYHDWNERINAECYMPNSTSRILDEAGRIREINNNYAKISFNFGPTLLSWLEEKSPRVYEAVLDADRASQRTFEGHGSALAQPYNHLIMPLAKRRDKVTQVRWGIADFQHRFRRPPEGMWLPETAVDVETLEVLAEEGIGFTILAPHQARRVRAMAGGEWHDVSGARVDTSRPYLCRLPSGRSIALFFYHGPVSRAVAFERLLDRGEAFADRLLEAFPAETGSPRIVTIATDGESYGHHHRHGEMALSYALHHIESKKLARITNYGAYLARFPPADEVEIHEFTSWSCAHGVERWRTNCGCNSGSYPNWNQEWRKPLREAMDHLRDRLAVVFERAAQGVFADPWAARDDYIRVILDRHPEVIDGFFRRHCGNVPTIEDKTRLLRCLELERHALLMFTSCGWFFDELSGIETSQVIHYAGRAIQLAQTLGEAGIESSFLSELAQAKSNLAEHGTGRQIYERWVGPARVDLPKVGAHYALSSLFQKYEDASRVYCYTVERSEGHVRTVGEKKLAFGRLEVASVITLATQRLEYIALHLGDHNVHCGVRPHQGEEKARAFEAEATRIFDRADLPGVIRLIDREFPGATYSLISLFKDERTKIVNTILNTTLEEVEAAYRQTYERYAPLLRFLAELNIPLPRALQTTAEFVLNGKIRRALETERPDPVGLRALLEEARQEHLRLDAPGLGFALQSSLERTLESLHRAPYELPLLQSAETVANLTNLVPFTVELRRAQNSYYDLVQRVLPAQRARAEGGERYADEWVKRFEALGERLGVRAR